jgi:glucose/arabinose dehydrogenase
MHRWSTLVAATALLAGASGTHAARQAPASAVRTIGPYTLTTVAGGFESPWSLAFLPDGTMLVTELPGRLRVIRNGVLDPAPVPGLPAIFHEPYAGLMDVIVHPQFDKNGYVYLSYNKQGKSLAPMSSLMGERLLVPFYPAPRKPADPLITTTLAVARGKWNGTTVAGWQEIWIADDWKDQTITATTAGRMTFGRDGMLYVAIGGANAPASAGHYMRVQGGVAQDPARHGGKVVRLRDDGTVPPDNPFVKRRGYKAEIYTMGHRNILGLATHPVTGEIWEHENGPADGDELNVLKPGANYGWPAVGMGRDYTGDYIGGTVHLGAAGRPDAYKQYMEGMEQPFVHWAPTSAPSGMLFYTGDKLPGWTGSLFIGHLQSRRVERFVISEKKIVTRREELFAQLNERIRDVRQSPDGYVYIVTDSNKGQVIKVALTPTP